MASVDGPRLASHEEFDEVMALLDRCFRFDRGGMREAHPYVYDPSQPERHAVIVSDGEIVAHAGVVSQTLVAGSAEVECPGIGGVATHPDHRGSGYMTSLLEFWLDRLDSEGVPLIELGGDRKRYSRFGFENAGREFRFRITPRSFPEPALIDSSYISDNTDTIDIIHQIHSDESYRVRRDRQRAQVVHNQRGVETLVFRNEAYLSFTRDRSDAEVVEFGGSADGVEKLLGHVFAAFNVSSLTAYVPPNHTVEPMFRRVSGGWQTTLLRKVAVRDLFELLRGFEPQLADRWQRAGGCSEGSVVVAVEGGNAARLCYTDDELYVEEADVTDSDVLLNQQQITHFLFGFPGHSIPEREHHPVLSTVFPAKYYIWCSERV